MAKFSNWDFSDKAVDPILLQGKYINARSTLIAAGPPKFDQASGTDLGTDTSADNDFVYPIGFIENFGVVQQKNLQRMYEIGSDRAYFVPGRTMSSANLGRVLFHGPSLMRVLYAYYPQTKIVDFAGRSKTDKVKIAYTTTAASKDCYPDIIETPGTIANNDDCDANASPTFYMNLASTLFDRPMGLLVYLKDINNEYYSAFYLEFCYITTHNMSINATSTIIAEGVGIQFDRVVPCDLS